MRGVTLVLLRHGESVWNRDNRFTGWTDIGLTERGEEQARKAGELLAKSGFSFDACHTSLLKRAIKTLWIALEALDQMWLPTHKSWRLNERHYGALQGLNKAEAAREFGEAQVFAWRRGFADRPPPLGDADEGLRLPDSRYAGLDPAEMPRTESLKDAVHRVVPYWESEIAPEVRQGKRILIAAHGNSLRGLVKFLDEIPDGEITKLEIPTGEPLVYELTTELRPLRRYYLSGVDPGPRTAVSAGPPPV